MKFTSESLVEIVAWLTRQDRCAIEVLDPDRHRGFAGERVTIDGTTYVHRPFRVWVDLASRLGLRLLTPRAIDAPLIELRFERLSRARDAAIEDPTEKYGTDSPFARIAKLEDPDFAIDFREALERVALPAGARILDLGVNRGDELALIASVYPGAQIVGIDHSASAIAASRARFPLATFHHADVAAPIEGRFDLVVSIDTLQSPGIDDRAMLRRIVQDLLVPRGAVIIGFPNCRYLEGEVQFGTRMKNFTQPELGLLVKDLAFYRKYLQQHDRIVFITGKHEILVAAVDAKR